jgi:hypothetical protein
MGNILTQWKATASQDITFYFGLSGIKAVLACLLILPILKKAANTTTKDFPDRKLLLAI